MFPPMDDEERALLRAICANPDANAPRLIYADWLDEQGDRPLAQHAELIRASIPEPMRRLELEQKLAQPFFLNGATLTLGQTIMERLADPDGKLRLDTMCMLRSKNWTRGLPCFMRSYSVTRFWQAVDAGVFLRVPLTHVQVDRRKIQYRSGGKGPSGHGFSRSPDEREVQDENELPGAVCRWLNDSLTWPNWDEAFPAVERAFALAGREASGLLDSPRS